MEFTERWDVQLILGKTNSDSGIDLGNGHAFLHKTLDNSIGRKVIMEELYMTTR